MKFADVKELLDLKADQLNKPNFIQNDPVQIPHRFKKKQDIEISGLFAATLAWGQRKTIISNCNKLMSLMEDSPHDFILNYKETDLDRFSNFKHRTFNPVDLKYFLRFLRWHYSKNNSLEDAFAGNDIESR